VDEQRPAAIALDLGDVVSDVVDLPRLLRGLAAEHGGDRGAHLVRDSLPVRPGEVRRRGHRGQVGAALGRGGGCAGELAVGELDPMPAHDRVHVLDVVAADLVAEPARAGVDQHRCLILGKPVSAGGRRVEDPRNPLQLDEVVAGAHRPELAGGALARPLGDCGRVAAGQAAA
jgi:hypothetical protein